MKFFVVFALLATLAISTVLANSWGNNGNHYNQHHGHGNNYHGYNRPGVYGHKLRVNHGNGWGNDGGYILFDDRDQSTLYRRKH